MAQLIEDDVSKNRQTDFRDRKNLHFRPLAPGLIQYSMLSDMVVELEKHGAIVNLYSNPPIFKPHRSTVTFSGTDHSLQPLTNGYRNIR